MARSIGIVVALVLALEACAAEPCPAPVDAGSPDVPDSPACESRLVVGPVIITAGTSPFSGDGVPLSVYPPRDLRVRLLRADRSVAVERVLSSVGTSDYLDVGAVLPGRYSVVVEVVGTSLVAGGYLTGEGGCLGPLAGSQWCLAPVADIRECDLLVLPVGMGCDDPTETTCGELP